MAVLELNPRTVVEGDPNAGSFPGDARWLPPPAASGHGQVALVDPESGAARLYTRKLVSWFGFTAVRWELEQAEDSVDLLTVNRWRDR